MADIFISYAHEDRPRAHRLAGVLERQGWSVWWDTRLKAGEIWDEVIERELSAARCVVVLWSGTSIQRHWVRVEAGEGLKRQVLIPALIDDVQPPLAFRLVQSEHLTHWFSDPSHPSLHGLLAAIAERLQKMRRDERIAEPVAKVTFQERSTVRPETPVSDRIAVKETLSEKNHAPPPLKLSGPFKIQLSNVSRIIFSRTSEWSYLPVVVGALIGGQLFSFVALNTSNSSFLYDDIFFILVTTIISSLLFSLINAVLKKLFNRRQARRPVSMHGNVYRFPINKYLLFLLTVLFTNIAWLIFWFFVPQAFAPIPFPIAL